MGWKVQGLELKLRRISLGGDPDEAVLLIGSLKWGGVESSGVGIKVEKLTSLISGSKPVLTEIPCKPSIYRCRAISEKACCSSSCVYIRIYC